MIKSKMLKFFKKIVFLIFSVFFCIEINTALAQNPIQISIDLIPLKIKTEQGIISYEVELAFSPVQSKAGLMYRTDFPRDRAMLFKNLMNNEQIFMWMANTPLSLDMIFLNSEGDIVSIFEKLSPFSTEIISSKMPATFAIEVNAGEVFEKKIQKGQRVIHPAICGKCESN
ncbi:hypothetical protein H705_00757 [Bartonella bacilliformis Cond044]|nr:hypothetical protein H705_00757 [Bartonella bacilliformis Cond044]